VEEQQLQCISPAFYRRVASRPFSSLSCFLSPTSDLAGSSPLIILALTSIPCAAFSYCCLYPLEKSFSQKVIGQTSLLPCLIYIIFSRTCVARVLLRKSKKVYTSNITSRRGTMSEGVEHEHKAPLGGGILAVVIN
jgi:hypothetical protein